MDDKEFFALIGTGQERRNLEFKRSMPWREPQFKAKIAKSILGLSNIRDGGHIVIGLEKQGNGLHKLVGVQSEHLETYDEDKVSSYVAEFADPYVRFELEIKSFQGDSYIIFRVHEFDEIPVICKKDYNLTDCRKGDKIILRKGAIYTRPYRMYETVEVPSQTEIRDILEMATEKGIRKFYQRLSRAGVPFPQPIPEDDEKFKLQIRDIISNE